MIIQDVPFELQINYSDIWILPNHSTVKSRDNVDLSVNFLDRTYSVPAGISNMNTLSNLPICDRAAIYNIPMFLNRMMPIKDYMEFLKVNSNKRAIPTIGVSKEYLDLVNPIYDLGYEWIAIDVAHADSEHVLYTVRKVKKNTAYSNGNLIVGNVATLEGVERLAQNGADAARVILSQGNVCSTRMSTGVTRGVVNTLLDCRRGPIPIIADGGARTTSDIAKGLALGADLVIGGFVFAGTNLASGERKIIDGKTYISYYGNASAKSKQQANYPIKYIEGYEQLIPYTGNFDDMILSIQDGLRSAASYLGVHKITEMENAARFGYRLSN